MNADEAKKLSETSSDNLNKILEAIKRRAAAGYKWLELFEFLPCGLSAYIRTFNYNDQDLEELKKRGYTIEIEEDVETSGIWWWKKVIWREEYHTICW